MTISELYSLYLTSSKVTTDTRNITENSIFFALKGANFNGNEFAHQAIEQGASFAIVDELKLENPQKSIYYVEDTLQALQNLAQHHRSMLNIPIIALTGSNGKTTTKELITTVLSKKYNVLATKGNLNNHIGVPLTLLSINQTHDIAVIEMGANHQHEIEFLCKIAQPDYGYITNFGKAHLEGFGGIEGVIKGKSELYQYLNQNYKIAFVNGDDDKQVQLTTNLNTITFGTQHENDFNFKIIENNTGNCPALQYDQTIIQSQLVGNYNLYNVAAATTIGLQFEVEIIDIKAAIEDYQSDNNRSQIIYQNNKNIILDAYNANPSSMEAALNNFEKIEGKKSVILGDMFELGDQSLVEHQRIANLASSLKFDKIYLVGENFHQIELNLEDILMKFPNRTEAEIYFKEHPIKEENLLIKGSRGMALEKLLEFIQ